MNTIHNYIGKIGLFLMLAVLCSVQGKAQALDNIFQSVLQNNITLKAERERNNSDKLLAQSGITPDNPSLEYGYYPGNSDAIGTKQVLAISQSIDFPTTYRYKNKIAEQKGLMLDEKYHLLLQDVLFQTWQAYVHGVYYNQYISVLNDRIEKAEQMLTFYEKKQTNGDATQLEVNKARLFLINLQNRARIVEGEILANNELLRMLNGGTPLTIVDAVFINKPLELWDDFQVKIDSMHPMLKQMAYKSNEAEYLHKLNKANGLPQLMLGYEREQILGDVYGGVKAGISIPLWQNKNQIKYAKANIDYLQAEQENVELSINADYYQRYIQCNVLYGNMVELKNNLEAMNNEHLLARSLALGQISIIDYFWEMDYFYLTVDHYLEMELTYQLSLARLYQFSL